MAHGRVWRATYLAFALVAITAGGVADAAAKPVLLNGFGFWTLGRMGYARADVPVAKTPARRPPGFVGLRNFAYLLPKGAGQGPRRWYTLELHLVVTLRRDSGPGDAYVDGEINGTDAVMFELHVARAHHKLVSKWDTYDLIDGLRRGEVAGRELILDESNYLVRHTVRGGLSTLTIRVEEYQRARIQAIHVLPDSGIHVTGLGIPRVELTLSGTANHLTPGHRFSVRYTVRSNGGAPVRAVTVVPQYDPQRLEQVGGSVDHYRLLGRERSGTFRFKALKAGTTRIRVGVLSSADNQPTAEMLVRVDRAPRGGTATGAVAGLAAVVIILGAGWATLRRRHQSRRSLTVAASR